MPSKKKRKKQKAPVFAKCDEAGSDGEMTALDLIEEQNPEALKAEGFDDCILGVAYRCGKLAVLAYDRRKCVEKLMKDGMDHDEAEEFMGVNVEGSWLGEGTPIFIEVVP